MADSKHEVITATNDITLTPEMSQAIAMAERKPRSLTGFIKNCTALATMDEQTAADCLYALPRKEKDDATGKFVTKMIEGPSARFAEIINYEWGNCRAEGRITDDRGEFVTAQGTWVDLEKNSGVRTETRRRITTKRGDRYSADMIMQTGNAAISIARRNAILAGIPKVFWIKIYEAARQVVAGDARTLVNRRDDALAYMQKIGATTEMVLAALDVKGVEEITLDHLATLRGMATAIKEGEATIEEIFSKKEPEQAGAPPAKNGKEPPKPGATTAKAKDALKGKDAPRSRKPEQSELEALVAIRDKAGVPDNALLKRYDIDDLGQLSGEQFEDAMRFLAGVLTANDVPA